MTIQVGDSVPEATFMTMTDKGPAPVPSAELFGGKTVVLFGLPGAFTPTCSAKHVPGFVGQADALKAKGVDTIACISVNDAFVMGAWGKDQKVEDKVLMLADGNADFTRKAGLDLDLAGFGMGTRSKRYAVVVKDGKVAALAIEPNPSALDVSSAEAVLKLL
ncbi:peroxiredoxin [Oleomonas cavernae]|uniref:Glutathione-dependent peroxiredoxin n=1 Tax=Oleomonas cavernae TaxID=2320859 RepID=A0A418WDJ0_9PROT|nr:peroxiredoxin [Oleomonas cavernae]RJF88097.1 peroxiredoxin [Oleomonas cavernae]